MTERTACSGLRSALAACLLALATLAVIAAAPAQARKHEAPTAPGKYSDWNGDIDKVEVVIAWKLGDYRRVVVLPLDTSAVELPDKDDNTYEPVKMILAGATPPMATGLATHVRPGVEVIMAPPEAPGTTGSPGGGEPGTLLVRGKVLSMDPGSRAARYFAGFGAGAARTKITGEVVDAESGAVLVRFTQERRSGVGAAGGGYVELMSRNLGAIGEDLAELLNAF